MCQGNRCAGMVNEFDLENKIFPKEINNLEKYVRNRESTDVAYNYYHNAKN